MRGLTDVKYILLDEADFFSKGEQENARAVSERYATKSGAKIIMVSTPNLPGGLFEIIELEDSNKCIYHRVFLDYRWGVGKVYSTEDIERAKLTPSFSREFNLQYGSFSGNSYSEYSISKAIEKGRRLYDPTKPEELINSAYFSKKVMGVDPAWGSSNFGIVLCDLIDAGTDFGGHTIRILYAEDFSRAQFDQMIQQCLDVLEIFGMRNDPDCKVLVDGANPAFIKALRIALNEDPNYERIIEQSKKYKFNIARTIGKVQPILFGNNNSRMMQEHVRMLLDNQFLAIHPSMHKLITFLRGAYEENGLLLKDKSPYSDVGDAFKLACSWFKSAK